MSRMSRGSFVAIAVLALAAVPAHAGSKVVPADKVEWKALGIPGVEAAPIAGDMNQGPSRFLLKYPKGLVTPNHHHSADHSAVVVSGTFTLTVDGKDYDLGPGSTFELTAKAAHVARVRGDEEVIFLIDARGPWDVVAEK